MSTEVVDSLVRHAASVSRRASLPALGGAALAAVAAGSMAGEAKKGKNQKKKARKRCKKQVEACQELLTTACGQVSGCVVADLIPCCSPLASCQAGESLTCYADYFRSIR